ncbi:MAG: hypothetical protein K2J16_00575 [Clostridia bacterium]|nr:hypothetical protein [Clostridia bacterium]
MDEEILNALLKRAKGYSYKEVQEEYAVKDDGEIALTKRKVLEKYCPPDSSALKTYMELNGDKDVSELSDEELEKEKMRLLKELEKQEEEKSNAERKEKSKRGAKK